MDPALQELISAGSEYEWVRALLRRKSNQTVLPSWVKEITRFGPVSTVRIRRGDIRKTWALKNVASLKAPRLLKLDELPSTEFFGNHPPKRKSPRRPKGLSSTGKGVVIGCLDWGLDFTHQAFRNADGTTRLLAIWDQDVRKETPAFPAPQPWGYGRLITREDINKALQTRDPFKALNFKFDDRKRTKHATHVLDIAAGSSRAGFHGGMAPDADLVFVQMQTGRGPRADLGDTVQLPEAIDFVHRIAGNKPCVINMSLGSHSSSHDGRELVSMMNDNFLRLNKNRMIVQSAGNYYQQRTHTYTQLFAGRSETFTWEIDPRDITMNELEFWYSNKDVVVLSIKPPGKKHWTNVPLGSSKEIRDNKGRRVVKAYHRAFDPNSPSHHIDIFIDPKFGFGKWSIKIRPIKILDGKIHGWIERDQSGFLQSRFSAKDVVQRTTLGSICNGYYPLVVGASVDTSSMTSAAPFTSSGPTRDNRQKPDIGAPGLRVIAAGSDFANGNGAAHNKAAIESGSSMGAPYVTGVVACCMEAAGKSLSAMQIRKTIQYTAKKTSLPERLGAGIVDPVRAERFVRKRYKE